MVQRERLKGGGGGAESRARGCGMLVVAGCWCPARPRSTPVGYSDLGSAGRRLDPGALGFTGGLLGGWALTA